METFTITLKERRNLREKGKSYPARASFQVLLSELVIGDRHGWFQFHRIMNQQNKIMPSRLAVLLAGID